MADRLRRYRDKRDAAATPEPGVRRSRRPARRRPESTQPESIKSGRTVEQVAAGRRRKGST